MSKLGGITVDGQEYLLDDLSLGELEELEEALGAPMNEINFGSARALKYAVYFLLRGARPGFTLEDAAAVKAGALVPEKVLDDTGVPLDPTRPQPSGESAPALDASVPELSGLRS